MKERFEIKNRYSEALKTNYSAVYRTREEYIEAFKKISFALTRGEDMFEGNSPLNRFLETRLRIYLFTEES